MARKRMFSKDVINNDNFIEMPDSSQNLYFHLSLDADDDGFVANYKSIMRMLGKKDDDLKVLIAKQFIIPFANGVLVIRHWKLNNYIQKDRYKETIYKEEKALLSVDNSNVYNMDTNCIHSIDKIRLDKISIEESSSNSNTTKKENIFEFLEKNFGRTISPIEYEKIIEWEKHFSEDIIKHAISESCLNNAKTMNYLTTILQDWKSKGFTKLSEIEDRNKNKKQKQKEPEWLNQEIEKETATDDEIDEIANLLKNFK